MLYAYLIYPHKKDTFISYRKFEITIVRDRNIGLLLAKSIK